MKYDYIFAGLGLASMMMIVKMENEGILEGKNILAVEPNDKNANDRTWCFWEEDDGDWDQILTHKWSRAFYVDENVKIDCLNGSFYKMIESKNFYDFFRKTTRNCSLNWVKESVISFREENNSVIVQTSADNYEGAILFNSIFDIGELDSDKNFPLLQQNFVGWFIETDNNYFNPEEALFMDFSVSQKGNTRFMYVLPLSENKALVEYTLFSPELLSFEEYELEIKEYLKKIGVENYNIQAKEKGNIPMTTYPFWKKNSKLILNIGTAGGWTKASSGFTFSNVIRESQRVVDFLKRDVIDFKKFKAPTKFTFYDDLFVDVLYNDNSLGKVIFSSMFTKSDPNLILKFLDEKTTVFEDLQIIWSCPKKEFIKSFFRRLIK